MGRTPEPDGSARDTEPDLWWWRGLRTVLQLLEAVAALRNDEALVLTTRALIVLGEMTVEAGEHRRS
ncbi:hypothetical protein [Crossiella sp. CA198]|uniref:hypothetical protein n=1 Tax=Crossiella sp. CA198 TaxID=3455607 RepID=UPI003F8D579A